jgi:hypothetical protein
LNLTEDAKASVQIHQSIVKAGCEKHALVYEQSQRLMAITGATQEMYCQFLLDNGRDQRQVSSTGMPA